MGRQVFMRSLQFYQTPDGTMWFVCGYSHGRITGVGETITENATGAKWFTHGWSTWMCALKQIATYIRLTLVSSRNLSTVGSVSVVLYTYDCSW